MTGKPTLETANMEAGRIVEKLHASGWRTAAVLGGAAGALIAAVAFVAAVTRLLERSPWVQASASPSAEPEQRQTDLPPHQEEARIVETPPDNPPLGSAGRSTEGQEWAGGRPARSDAEVDWTAAALPLRDGSSREVAFAQEGQAVAYCASDGSTFSLSLDGRSRWRVAARREDGAEIVTDDPPRYASARARCVRVTLMCRPCPDPGCPAPTLGAAVQEARAPSGSPHATSRAPSSQASSFDPSGIY